MPNGYNPQDTSNPLVQAFCMANAIGQIQNPVGGVGGGLASATGQANTLSIGGDMATMPIVTAAASAWKQMSSENYYTRGFLGMNVTTGKTADYIWGHANGASVSGDITLGKDVLVFIIAKNSQLPTTCASYFSAQVNGCYNCSTANIAGLLQYNSNTGFSANVIQAYGYDANNGSATVKNGNTTFLSNTQGMSVGSQAILATDDQNMVALVGADPFGIGFCSSAMVDPNQVQVIGIGTDTFPQTNPKYHWIMPAASSTWASTGYASFVRTLYATLGGQAAAGSNSFYSNSTAILSAIQAGPLFSASYLAN